VVEIIAPLLLPSLLFAWFVAAIMIVGDLDAPLMLGSAGTRTVSIHTYKLFEGAQESQAAALLTVILASILLVAGLHAVIRRVIIRRASPDAAPRATPAQLRPLLRPRALGDAA
jgi:ABC-type Fe3+ transport system permease subunit